MSRFSRLRIWVRRLWHGDGLDADIDGELDAWVQELADRYAAEGMTPAEARRRSRLETGGVDSVKDAVRDVRAGALIDVFSRDLRYAVRGLRHSPWFAAVTILMLAFGVGASTAIFGVVNALLIAPLPYRDASHLVFIWSDLTSAGYARAPLSGPELKDVRERTRTLEAVGAVWVSTASLVDGDTPEAMPLGFVTPDFFSILGVDPSIGRTFREEDARPGRPTVAILSARLWTRRYGADPRIVGKTIRVDLGLTTVIGVLPPDFRLRVPPDAGIPDNIDLWAPLWPSVTNGPRGQKFLRLVGRKLPTATLEAVRVDIARVAAEVSHKFPDYGQTPRIFLADSLQRQTVRLVRPALLAVLSGVVLLLTIACANVATLLIARASARSAESALLLALGANQRQLLRRHLAEGLVLAAAAGVIGLAIGAGSLWTLVETASNELIRTANVSIDGTVFLFTAAVSMGSGLVVSCAPVFAIPQTELITRLRRADPRRAIERGSFVRKGLFVVELALSLVLIVASLLLARTVLALSHRDAGFQSAGVVTFRLPLSFERYGRVDVVDAVGQHLRSRLARLPEVTAVGAISHLPYERQPNWGGSYDYQPAATPTGSIADYRAISPGFFEAIGARLVAGRTFTGTDGPTSPPVVIIDDRLADRMWPGTSAVGRVIAVDPLTVGHPDTVATVVGVVRHLSFRGPEEDIREQIYLPTGQVFRRDLAYIVRTTAPLEYLTPQIQGIVGAIDPELPIVNVRLLSNLESDSWSTQRFAAGLASIFACLALALATTGAYAVITLNVTILRRDLAMRLALGAQRADVIVLVLREHLHLTVIGLVFGTVAVAAAAYLLRHQLYGVSPFDIASYAGGVVLLATAMLAASWLPARQAVHDPFQALRNDG